MFQLCKQENSGSRSRGLSFGRITRQNGQSGRQKRLGQSEERSVGVRSRKERGRRLLLSLLLLTISQNEHMLCTDIMNFFIKIYISLIYSAKGSKLAVSARETETDTKDLDFDKRRTAILTFFNPNMSLYSGPYVFASLMGGSEP